MTTIKKIAGVTAAGCAAMLLVAGCSSSNDSAPVPTAAGPSSTTVKVSSLVLTQDDMPDGYEVMKVPESQIKAAIDSLVSGTRDAKITPAGCGEATPVSPDADVSKLGIVVALKSTDVLAETVEKSDTTIDMLKSTVTGKCAKKSISISKGEAAGAKGTLTTRVVDSSNLKLKDVVVLDETSKITLKDGKVVNSEKLMGFARVGDYLVAVQGNASAGGSPDLKAFNSTFAKAVAKVQAKTS